MRIVVMSDIHGNLEALQTVAASLPQHDRVIVAGDHCLDGPAPSGVLDMLGELGWDLLLGNTDRDIGSPPEYLKKRRSEMLEWTREQLGEDRVDVLRSLSFSIRVEDDDMRLLVVHANPRNLDDHLHPQMCDEELEPYLRGVEADVLAFGHLHTPYTRPVAGVLLVDVSSVGHPKDGDLRSAYTLVEWNGQMRAITQYRVPYDVECTVRALRESGMPHAEKQIAKLLKASY